MLLKFSGIVLPLGLSTFCHPLLRPVVSDAPLHIKSQQLRFVSSALKTTALRTYVPQIIAEADAYFASWGDHGTVDLLDCMARLTILTASRCLLGPEVSILH